MFAEGLNYNFKTLKNGCSALNQVNSMYCKKFKNE